MGRDSAVRRGGAAGRAPRHPEWAALPPGHGRAGACVYVGGVGLYIMWNVCMSVGSHLHICIMYVCMCIQVGIWLREPEIAREEMQRRLVERFPEFTTAPPEQ